MRTTSKPDKIGKGASQMTSGKVNHLSKIRVLTRGVASDTIPSPSIQKDGYADIEGPVGENRSANLCNQVRLLQFWMVTNVVSSTV